jgi:hypothetical protein
MMAGTPAPAPHAGRGLAERPTSGATGARGPHSGILAAVSLALVLAALLVTVVGAGRTVISPFAATGDVTAFFHDHPTAVRWSAMLQLGSAVPLGICAATVYARQLRLGVRVPGPVIGLFGGVTAAVLLMLSASATWVLSRPEVTSDTGVTQALAYLAFVTGGVGYVVGLGLLVAGVAVPALILRLLPRWLAWAGLLVAAVSELSFLSMTVEPLQVLLPIGRFSGLVWLIAAGFLLPRTRAAANRASSPGGAAGSGIAVGEARP